MNGFDVALLMLLGGFVFLGVLKGLTRLLIGIGALVAAFLLAARFHGELAHRLGFEPEEFARLAAYLMIFFGTMMAGAVLAFITRKLLKVAMLSWADRLAGAALGLVAAMLISALIILPMVAYSPMGERALRDSKLAPYVSVVADLANMLVPEELSQRYRQRIDDLRRHWRERWDEQVDPQSRQV